MSFGLEETESAGAEVRPQPKEKFSEAGGEAEGSAGGDVIGDLAGEETTPAPKAHDTSAGPKAQRSLRGNLRGAAGLRAAQQPRLELMPSFGFTLNDPYVSHPNVGIGLNYWITNVLAVGA